MVFVLANVSDIVTLNLQGVHSEVTLWESVWFTWLSGQEVVALLAGATAFAFPLAVILLRLYVLAPLAAGRRVRGFVPAMRALRWVARWSMVEVFLFGTLVAIVKIAGLASVIPGVGIFSFGMLTLLLAANQVAGLHGIWQHAWKLPVSIVSNVATAASVPTAVSSGLLGCECCGLVSEVVAAAAPARCPRCGFALHARKPQSLQRTTAYLLAAAVLYLPANTLPIMATASTLTGRESHTILGGIIELWHTGSWDLALIVFIASIAVPILKIVALTLLAFTARRKSRWRQMERATLYRVLETVGHWSMLDVFVVVLLVGMVRFGAFASVEPGPGLLAFGGVVVLTMLASASFDPRLIWPEPATDD